MKTRFGIVLILVAACSQGMAGESMLTQTFQPFDGPGQILIVPVMCYDPMALSGLPTGIELITARNIPPTNAPGPVGDFNIASTSGIKLSYSGGRSSHGIVTIDCTNLHVTESMICTEQQAVRATLECLRRVAGKRLNSMTITSKFKASGQEDIRKIVAAFTKHPMDKEFPWK
jgi:hypothetical protein